MYYCNCYKGEKMKKIFCTAALITFGFIGAAQGSSLFVEEYTGFQGVTEGNSYFFGFDMWEDQSPYAVTDSSLTLEKDAAGAFEDWESAMFYVDLFSKDWSWEKAAFTLTVSETDETKFNLGTYWFNGADYFGFGRTTISFNFLLNDAQIAAFDSVGLGSLSIAASFTGRCNYNDFGIEKVGLAVTTAPVPEPATMLLFGTGLAGLAGISRRKRK